MCVISSPRTSRMGRRPRNGMDGVANAKEEDKERIPVPYKKKREDSCSSWRFQERLRSWRFQKRTGPMEDAALFLFTTILPSLLCLSFAPPPTPCSGVAHCSTDEWALCVVSKQTLVRW